MKGFTGSILLFTIISFVKANTSPTISNFVYNVCEDTPKDQEAFRIIATDLENDPLTYRLGGTDAAYFTVDELTGSVKVKIPLDREIESILKCTAYVSDGPNETPGELTIILDDHNDNKPIFLETSYDVDVEETTSVGATLFRVQANDPDTAAAGSVKYTIDEVIPTNGVGLFSIVGTTGEVKLQGELNYNNLGTFYRLKITATDGGGRCYHDEVVVLSSSVFSVITVVDMPDLDPQFLGEPFAGQVVEHAPVAQSVLEVKAIDRDTGINDAIIYTIESASVDGLFQISRDGGVISVMSDIDRETVGDTVTLVVKATETNPDINGIQASATATVVVTISDINDNQPDFYKCAETCAITKDFTGEVFEHSLGAISFDMTVKDPDKNSRTQLTLEGVDKDVFSVEPALVTVDTVVQLLVKQTENLDFEKKQQMILQVIAVDEEKTEFRSTATVTINIKDTNDHSPVFLRDTYKLAIPEHSPVDTVLETITAEDPDTMDEGKITYSLLPENILQYFDVRPTTGEVFVKSSELLDRELRSLYTATLQARDSDGKPGTTVLEITLTDINDKTPVMNRDSYLEFVDEGQRVEVKIEATDADEPGTPNSQIVFSIKTGTNSDLFTIDPNSGVLTNSKELDREALDPEINGKILLTVVGTDKGTPALSSSVPVTISVEDINDNAPKFLDIAYSFSVKEGEKGAIVGSVYAEDLDQSSNYNRISFRITDGSFGSFIVESIRHTPGYRGDIRVDPDIELDYESSRKQFSLKVEAMDLGNLNKDVIVEVIVLDVNDERPEFLPASPLSVKENTTITEAIGKFTAQDKDGNFSLVYQLESTSCRCDGSWTPCNYFTVNDAGEIRLDPLYVLDYEQCDQAMVEAQVVDEYTEKGENNSVVPGQMVINIEDINDNAPEFIFTDSVFVVVPETASTGTSVARVTASDRDSGENRQIEFEVIAVQFEDDKNQTTSTKLLFEAVTTQQEDSYYGIIQTTESIDMNTLGTYLVTVRANNKGLFTDTVLNIYKIGQGNKRFLDFVISEAEVQASLFQITSALERATQAYVKIVAIRSDSPSESRNTPRTTMEAYFVYSNGTPVSGTEVDAGLSNHYEELKSLGLVTISNAPVETEPEDPLTFILLGILGGLAIVMVVLSTSLFCTRRNYRRKLKAAKAMNSTMNAEAHRGGPVVPGTNKYTMEGANPVLNLQIDTSVHNLYENSSDDDRVSVNSLDNSDIINNHFNQDYGLKKIPEEEDYREPTKYDESLGAALAQLGPRRGGDKIQVGLNNPVFDTTDL